MRSSALREVVLEAVPWLALGAAGAWAVACFMAS
jgi:hypothetical protein